jgi:hypothetical protein
VVKSGIGQKKRMVVLMDVEFHGKKYPNIKFSIGDRAHMSSKVLLGLQFLSKTGMIVDPAQAIYPQNQTDGAKNVGGDEEEEKEIKEAFKTEKKSKHTQLFVKKFGSKKEQVAEMVNTLMGIESSDMNMAEKIEKARMLQAKASLTELKETCNIYIEAMKAEMYEPYSNIQTTLDEDFEWMLINNVPAESATRRLQAQIKEYQLQGTDEIVHAYSKMTPGQKHFTAEDKDKDQQEKDELYKKWKSLVNMGPKELESFIDSDTGKDAGLSRKEASKAGAKGKPIKSGRDSARAIVRMKGMSRDEWTANDWAWARRQVNFITRMKGAAGKMRESDGTPTRKLMALKIWGHNPEK